jgi:hypothetical protein
VAFRRGCAQAASAGVVGAAPSRPPRLPGIKYLSPDISWAEYLMPQLRQILRDGDDQSFKLAFAGIGCNEVALLQRK